MLRSAWIFLAAILLPSLVLAWLAIRSARDQQVLLEHQQAVISQDVADNLAKNVRGQVDNLRSEFVQITQDLLSKSGSSEVVATNFDHLLCAQWAPAEVGFAVDLRGRIYSPDRDSNPAARIFRDENERFLTNRENVEVYASLNSQNLVAKQVLPVLKYDAEEQQAGLGKSMAVTGSAVPAVAARLVASNTAPVFEENHSVTAPQGKLAEMASKSTVDAAAESAMKAVPRGAPADSLAQKDKSNAAEAGAEMERRISPDATAMAMAMPTTTTTTAQVPVPVEASVTAPNSAPASASAASTTDLASSEFMPKSVAASNSRLVSPPPVAAPSEPVLPGAVASGAQPASPAPSEEARSEADSPTVVDRIVSYPSQKIARQVSPQNTFNAAADILSNTVPEESDFRKLIGNDTSGVLARFLDNKLQLMCWFRPSIAGDLVFGAQLNAASVLTRVSPVLQDPDFVGRGSSLDSRNSAASFCLALLDDTGNPVALSVPGFKADWKHPFVATEIGEALPHWEAALYLIDPRQLSKSAHTLWLTVSLIVLVLVVAIVAGGSLIAADIGRQVRAAQQKTDFVSNVSHELKTPLTSIRMFADLLAEGRVTEPERQVTYLKIISAESARLSRLINNVLDFARQEKGAPPGERQACDLVETTREVVETCAPHLEANGQNFSWEIEAETLPLVGERDALAQAILNLISNAEKYGGGEILVRVRRQESAAGALGCVDVLDRGAGVPPKQVESIFLPFHRVQDSLAQNVPGSGLGLTLARRMARVHGGDITYTPRAGGGSCFTLSVPVTS